LENAPTFFSESAETLELYVRQLAWLTAVPKNSKRSRRSIIDATAEANGIEPEYGLPDVAPVQYVVEVLSDMGEAVVEGSVLRQLNWTDIADWQRSTGVVLTYWECAALHRLSGAYVNQFNKALEPSCPRPVVDELPSRVEVAQKMRMFASLFRKRE